MITVVIADDHEVVRAGLAMLIETFEDVRLVGAAGDGRQAAAMCEATTPDVALVDVEMPVLDGVAAIRRIREVSPATAAIVFTSFAERHRVLRAMDAGAAGYLLKDVSPDELHRAIQAAAQGGGPLAPRAAAELTSGGGGVAPELSPREREVLLLLTEGLANKQIARRLGIAEKTVKGHLTRIFRAIDVSDRTQAALWVERHVNRRADLEGLQERVGPKSR
jgi:DNA-binding NarL/FixJ family response regulator